MNLHTYAAKLSWEIANHFARVCGVAIYINGQDWGTSGIDANGSS